VTARRTTPRPLDVYALLPQTNCKQCGEATCMAFAFALLQHRRALAECLPLVTDETLAGQHAAIEALI
jgi:4Fe-4S ferredoxin